MVRAGTKMKLRLLVFALVGTILVGTTPGSSQDLSAGRHMSGQGVQPTFEGWEHKADGSFDMVFGYMNRNYEEQLDVPVGADNAFDFRGADHGQPTHFYPRRNQFVFRVNVPTDWDAKRRLVWTLKANGQTNYAKGILLPEFELNPGVIAENSGGIVDYDNKPPVVTGEKERTVGLSQPLSLNVSVTDDGRPVLKGPRGRSGVTVTWQQ